MGRGGKHWGQFGRKEVPLTESPHEVLKEMWGGVICDFCEIEKEEPGCDWEKEEK